MTRCIEKDVKGNRLDQFPCTVPIFAKRQLGGRKHKSSEDGRCAGRDTNTESSDNRLNCCPPAFKILFNVVYLREFVRVRALTVHSYAVSITHTTAL